MEKLLSSRSLKKDPEQRWEYPAVTGLILTIVAMSIHVFCRPGTEYESVAAFGVAALASALAGVMYCWVRLTSRLGLCPSIYHSTVLKPVVKDRSIRFQVVPGVYLSFFTGLFTLSSTAIVWELCSLEYSENVVPMLLVLFSPLLTALCAFIICKEGILFFQALGIVCECVGLVTLTLSVGGVMDWTSLVTGGAGLTVLTARSILLKITQEVRFDPTSSTLLELLTAGLVSCSIALYAYTADYLPLTDLTLIGGLMRVLEGFAWVSTAYFMNIALFRGPAALVLAMFCLSVDVFIVWLHPEWNSQLLGGLALTLAGAVCFLWLDKLLERTALGRSLTRPKKTAQRESFTSAAYIRLIDR